MKIIVITGSTRGIGYGLAREFLRRGCAVVISGRQADAVHKAVQSLAAMPVGVLLPAPNTAKAKAGQTDLYIHENKPQPEHVLGQPCDVTDYAQVQVLWDATVQRFGRVDLWINNAGVAHGDIPFWQQPPTVMREVLNVNVLGTMHGCKVAIEGMQKQGGGVIYNMQGFGSNGRLQFGLGVYGSSKAAINFFTRAVRLDAKDLPIKFGMINPGMVMTDLVVGQYVGREAEFEKNKRIFNIIGDHETTVTPFIVDKILSGELNVRWLSFPKLMWRFMTAGFIKRDLFRTAP